MVMGDINEDGKINPLLEYYAYVLSQSCPTVCGPMDCSLSVPLFMEFSRQEYWS